MAVDPSKIHLISVLPIQELFSIADNAVFDESLEFDIAHEMMHNLDEKKIKYSIAVRFNHDKTPVADFRYDFIFLIEDLEEQYELINEKPLFDGKFVSSLLAIVYSTTRGLLLGKFENTPLNRQLLPVINVSDLLRNKANAKV